MAAYHFSSSILFLVIASIYLAASQVVASGPQLCEHSDYIPLLPSQQTLHSGGQAQLSLFKNKQTGKVYVRKLIPLNTDDDDDDPFPEKSQWAAFITEVAILHHLKDNAFFPMLHCTSAHSNITFTQYEKMAGFHYFMMEYVPWHSLETWAVQNPHPDPLRTILWQLAQAIQAIHDKGIIHLDIKPRNILTNGTHVKLIDFGGSIAASLGFPESKYAHITRDFKPPESHNLTKAYDWYSFGATAYFARAMQLIKSSDYEEEYCPINPSRFSIKENDLVHLIKSCTKKDHTQRVTNGFKEIAMEKYFQAQYVAMFLKSKNK